MSEKIFDQNKEAVNKIKDYENAPVTGTQRTIITIVLAIITFGFITLFASAILQGVAAVVALVVMVVVGFFGYKFLKAADPVIKQKLKNESLKAMYKEASKNAIYQLDNDVITKKDKLLDAAKVRDSIKGDLKGLETDLRKTKADPDLVSAVPQIQQMYDATEKAYQTLEDNITTAQGQFLLWEKEVKIYKTKQKFADSANSVMSAINSEDSLGDQLTFVAMESIDSNFNTAMAAIENLELDKNFRK
jgi:hypothetical protein